MKNTEPTATAEPISIASRKLSKALLAQHFLPNQASHLREMPRSITTAGIKRKTAKSIVDNFSGKLRKGGYDAASYNLTKSNYTTRNAQIPHPFAYMNLVFAIEQHWEHIEFITNNPNSMIRPMVHKDGRIFVMGGYEESEKSFYLNTKGEPSGKRFVVDTDVRNLYHSIYSHSLAWALVGRKEAKINKRDQRIYYNRLDFCYSTCRRGETNGVAIGPGTSNIAAEIVMGAVDKSLIDNHHHTFHRHIDDYRYFAETLQEAEEFIYHLSRRLNEFQLSINESKTSIVELPQPEKPNWVNMLNINSLRSSDSSSRAHAYLDTAIRSSLETREISVLVYAIRVISKKLKDRPKWHESMVHRIATLCYHIPRLVPFLQVFCDRDPGILQNHENLINQIAQFAVKSGKSDATTWCIHLLISNNMKIHRKTSDDIVASRDCFPMLLLIESENTPSSTVTDFLGDLQQEGDDYSNDQFWPILYGQYLKGKLVKIPPDPIFSPLKESGIELVKFDT